MWTRVALWATLAATADIATKAGAAALYSHGVLRGRIIESVNPEFSLGIARAGFSFMILLAVLLIAAFGGWAARLAIQEKVPAWAPGLLIGGACANLADRIAFGAVHDWLLIRHVVFNVADFLILAGVIALGVCLARGEPRRIGTIRHRAGPIVRSPSTHTVSSE